MAFRLAEALHMPVREVMRTHTARDLALWLGYWRCKDELQKQAWERARLEEEAREEMK